MGEWQVQNAAYASKEAADAAKSAGKSSGIGAAIGGIGGAIASALIFCDERAKENMEATHNYYSFKDWEKEAKQINKN